MLRSRAPEYFPHLLVSLHLSSHFNYNMVTIRSKAATINTWRIFEREPLSSYVYGKTLLIGDAAHPGSTFASGGTQAIEDAGAVLGLFSEIPTINDLPTRLQLFEKVRLIRSSRVQAGGGIPWNKYKVPWASRLAELKEADGIPDGLSIGEKLDWDSR